MTVLALKSFERLSMVANLFNSKILYVKSEYKSFSRSPLQILLLIYILQQHSTYCDIENKLSLLPIFLLLLSFSNQTPIHYRKWVNQAFTERNYLLNTRCVFKHTEFLEFFFIAGILCFLWMVTGISTKYEQFGRIMHNSGLNTPYRCCRTEEQREWNQPFFVGIAIVTIFSCSMTTIGQLEAMYGQYRWLQWLWFFFHCSILNGIDLKSHLI